MASVFKRLLDLNESLTDAPDVTLPLHGLSLVEVQPAYVHQ